MTDVIKLIDAEMKEYSDGAYADHGSARDQLERFAELVAAQEREACAMFCESNVVEVGRGTRSFGPAHPQDGSVHQGMDYAAAIRARAKERT